MGLITILPGTEVDANDLDFNFKTLEQQISAGLEEINNLVEHTTYSLTALQNQIVDNKNTTDGQNSSLTESLNTVNSSKLDTNLSNITANGKKELTLFLMPDYSKKITIATSSTSSGSTPYTVEKNGYIIGYSYCDNATSYVSINDSEFIVGRQSGDGEGGNAFYFPVSQGDTVTWRRSGGGNKTTMYFVPCFGEG